MIQNEDVVIVDVRRQDEFDLGHIDGAILIPLNDLSNQVEEAIPNKKQAIIVYCRSGARSASAAKTLVNLGYEKIYDMGGIIEWQNEGFEVVAE